jgi:hypothetical protein
MVGDAVDVTDTREDEKELPAMPDINGAPAVISMPGRLKAFAKLRFNVPDFMVTVPVPRALACPSLRVPAVSIVPDV